MKTFKELAESPVGKVGRTKDHEAQEHIEGTNLEVKFRKLVKELGGKNVAKQLLAKMDIKDRKPVTEGTETPEKYLRNSGYKIKDEEPTKEGKELIFYKEKDAQNALQDLEDAGFGSDYTLYVTYDTLTYIIH